ncbi:MAG: serine protease [Candidatus Omnitrophica bacterium]|nr:serine protease [Candidatus Omnitrophota bacterium]
MARKILGLAAWLWLAGIPAATAAESSIAAVLDSAGAVVRIKAEAGGLFRDESNRLRAVTSTRVGAGFIIESGLIATNAHTVQHAGKITVILRDSTEAQATLVRLVPEQDLALIQIPPSFPAPPARLGDSDRLRIGDHVYTLPASALLQGTLNGGNIRGLGTSKRAPAKDAVTLIQLDFGLYQGDSGCPVFDRNGNVIGLITAALAARDKVTFAIPSNMIRQICLDYKNAREDSGKA